jgi:hypothetical protein
MFMERPQTEPMDGADGRLVKIPKCDAQKAEGGVRVFCLLEKAVQEGIVTHARSECGNGISQSGWNPLLEFLGGGLGEGDHQDLIHGEMEFQDEPQEKRCDGVRLSGSRAGFDQSAALQRAVEKIKGGYLISGWLVFFHSQSSCLHWCIDIPENPNDKAQTGNWRSLSGSWSVF